MVRRASAAGQSVSDLGGKLAQERKLAHTVHLFICKTQIRSPLP